MSIDQARADLERLLGSWKELAKAPHVPNTEGHRLRIDDLRGDIVGNVTTALWVLQGAVAFVSC
jgi:hypothetical protein